MARPAPEGGAAGDALQRLSVLLGKGDVDLLTLQTACGPEFSLAGMLAGLQRWGLQGRWAACSARALVDANLPTLVAGPSGTWFILCAHKGRAWLLEGAGGVRSWVSSDAQSCYQGTVLDLHEDLPSGGIWSQAMGLLLKWKRDLYPVVILGMISQLLAVLTPQWTRMLVDQVFPTGASSFFLLVLSGALCQAGFQAWLDLLQGRFSLLLENRLAYALERGLLARMFSLPFSFLRGKSLGELLQSLHGLAAAREYLTGQALATVLNGFSALFFLVLMFRQLPGETCGVLLLALLSTGGTMLAASHLTRLEHQVVDAGAKQWTCLVECFNGLPTLKAAGVEQRALGRWRQLFWRERTLGLRSQRIELRSQWAIGLTGLLQAQLLNVWCALAVLEGRLQLGEMLAFTLMASAFQAAVGALGSLFTQFRLLSPQLKGTREILEATPEPAPGPGLVAFRPEVQVEGLSFRYSAQGPWIYQDFQLSVAPGDKHRILGPSGAGKSTLLRLLAGLLQPETGRLALGGLEPREARPHFLYLPQGIRLFQGSLLENLRRYSCCTDLDPILQAAEATGLAELVARLPMGWNTWVSQGGGNFSGGQRQLVALTGVLASDRPLLLLDEAMANLDAIHQARLLANPLFGSKTILYAGHDSCFSLPPPGASLDTP